jgi:hypothetical protein
MAQPQQAVPHRLPQQHAFLCQSLTEQVRRLVDLGLPQLIRIYEYTWQSKPRQGTNLVVTLVSTDDPSQYCQANFKKTYKNGAKYEETKKAITHGARFIMSEGWLRRGCKATIC